MQSSILLNNNTILHRSFFMANSTYETHTMPDPYLPFIFHRDTVVTQKTNIPNWHENIEVLYCVAEAEL